MINKAVITQIFAGFAIGILVLVLNIFLSRDTSTVNENKAAQPTTEISYLSVGDINQLLDTTLGLFNLEDSELTKNGSNDLLSDDITIRIVAQAMVGSTKNTILEIISSTETEIIKVQEGSTVNGLLIKSIDENELVVEKGGTDYRVKLFHPKELNSTNTDQKNDSL